MNIKLNCVMLVNQEIENNDIRKNNTQKMWILMCKGTHALPSTDINTYDDIKSQIRSVLAHAIGSDTFHLEQVYTLGDKKYFSSGIDIIHLAACNMANIKRLAPKYELVEISIQNNTLCLGGKKYKYKTIEKIKNNNIEYLFHIDAPSIEYEKTFVEILTAWKHLRQKINYSDIIFKFLPTEFTLEDARSIYQTITEKSIDKSNFHKKIAKYCTELDKKQKNCGYRPGKMYKFNIKQGDIWL